MSFTVVIPARYASTRLPGKPLADIGGKSMIQHVYERAVRSGAAEVIVATDDERILEVVKGFGGAKKKHRLIISQVPSVLLKWGHAPTWCEKRSGGRQRGRSPPFLRANHPQGGEKIPASPALSPEN